MNKFSQIFATKAVPVALILFSLFTLLVLLYIYRYNFPSSDDYWYTGYTGNIHNSAQGLINNFMGALNAGIDCYKYANGRFVSNFLYALFLSPKDLLTYKLIPLSIFLLFNLSFIYLAAMSLKTVLPLPKLFFIALTLLSVLFISANHIHNTFYWMGGVVNYFFSLTLFLIAFYAFIKKPKRYTYIPLIFFTPLMVLVSLSNETLTFIGLWFYFVLLLCSIYYKSRYRITIAAVYILILFLGLLVVYLSPGTALRAASSTHEAGDLPWAVWHALILSFDKTAQWLCSPLIPLAFLTSAVIKDIELPRLKFVKALGAKGERIHSLLFFAFAFSIVWAGHFVSTFGRGGGGLPDRAKFMPRFFFIILTFAAIIYLIRSFGLETKLLDFKRSLAAFLLFFIMILPSRHFAPSILYLGEFGAYYGTLKSRYDDLLTSDKEYLTFIPAPFQPPLLEEKYFYTTCEEGGTSIASYFGKNCVVLEDNVDGYKNYKTLNSILKL
jgi:hypothetical protein